MCNGFMLFCALNAVKGMVINMKKTLKVVLIILLVLLLLCISLFVWQRKNISALYGAVKYSQEDISTLIADNEKIVSEALEEYPEFEIPDISESEMEALEEGKITQDDLVEIVLGKTSLEEVIEKKEETTKTEPAQNAGSKETQPPAKTSEPTSEQTPEQPSEQTAPSKSGDEEISALIAKIYILKQSYGNKLDALVQQTRSEYWAMPKEQRKDISKQKFVTTKASQALALEKECDAKVEEVISELTKVLKENNKDLSLVDSIRKAYDNEKQLKKSYYISEYLD